MFLATLFDTIFWIYFIATVGPAIALMAVIYNQDKVEREPLPLLMKLIGGGCLATIPAMILESVGEPLLTKFIDPGSPLYSVVLAFLVVAVAEEGSKFFFLRKFSWRSPYFDYRFDGIVYAVFVSLGFAALENIEYVAGYGLSVAPSRALLAIPGHFGFAVFMGYFYGRAKLWEDAGHHARSVAEQWAAVLSAVFFHGFYDACAMSKQTEAGVIFLIYVVAVDLIVFRLVKHESATDEPV